MKIKYLPEKERRTIRALKRMTDREEIAGELEALLQREVTLQVLWEYRKWFRMLTEEEVSVSPKLKEGLAWIYALAGEDEKIKMLGMEPSMERTALWTAGRPSVINGMQDLTPYADEILEKKGHVIEMLRQVYGERAEKIYDLMRAEILYQRDECYSALVLVVNHMPLLRDRQEMQLLFAALVIEIFILVIDNQPLAWKTLIDNIREQMISNGVSEYVPNVNALAVWSGLYDGDYSSMAQWMRTEAPNEHDEFCVLDLFQYLVKMRGYIIQGKYLAVTILGSMLCPLLEEGNRFMDLCELYLVWAMSDFASERKEEAFLHMDKALALAEKYRYDRLIADEAKPMFLLLKEYCKMRGKGAYLERVLALTEKTALLHPLYLKRQLPQKPALTEAEMKVLRLLADSRTNGEIAEFLGIAVDTVKQHCRHICRKLEVKNRHQAVQRAVELGVLEPPKTIS